MIFYTKLAEKTRDKRNDSINRVHGLQTVVIQTIMILEQNFLKIDHFRKNNYVLKMIWLFQTLTNYHFLYVARLDIFSVLFRFNWPVKKTLCIVHSTSSLYKKKTLSNVLHIISTTFAKKSKQHNTVWNKNGQIFHRS